MRWANPQPYLKNCFCAPQALGERVTPLTLFLHPPGKVSA
jgi:hypothetical protein